MFGHRGRQGSESSRSGGFNPANAPPIEAVATVVERLAVLLTAGVAPAAAWGYLAKSGGTDAAAAENRVVLSVAASGTYGSAIADAIADAVGSGPDAEPRAGSGADAPLERELSSAWRGLAAAWFVATESGAPLAPCLRSLAQSFRSLGETQRDLHVALAGPAATAKMVMMLPIVGILFGFALGFDTVHILFATMPGVLCLAGGALLMLAGSRWNRAMIRSAQPKSITPGLLVDLMAIGMAGGGSLERSRRLVAQAAARFDIDETPAARENLTIDQILALAQRAGVPSAELLRSEAEQLRRRARFDGQRAAASLAVKLMVPLGVCILPAFMLVGVVPLLMAVLSSTVSVL